VSYEFEGGTTTRDDVVRVLGDELDGAVARLRGDPDRVRAVHQARKHLKKTRSALRLVRGAVDGERRRCHNDRLRAAAHQLSGVRDAQVAVATIDRLTAARGGDARTAAVRQVLVERSAGAQRTLDGALVETIATALEAERAALAGLELTADGWGALRDGLVREYRRGRRALRAIDADRGGDAELLHAWRRRVKDLWYHLSLLAPSWPWVLEDTAEQAHDLSDLLGDDHDLANLRALLTEEDGPLAAAGDPASLLARVDAERARLQSAAQRLGIRLYAESPRAVARRLGAYHRAWRHELGLEGVG
jgi:CHAD domain-containing protein